MNKKQYITLCSNFNKSKDKEHYELLEEMFKNEDEIYMDRAVKKIIQEDKYFPSVARIKEVLDEVHKEPLSEDEKLKKWAKEGFCPSWLSKDKKNLSYEELKKLQNEFDERIKPNKISYEKLEELQNDWDMLFG